MPFETGFFGLTQTRGCWLEVDQLDLGTSNQWRGTLPVHRRENVVCNPWIHVLNVRYAIMTYGSCCDHLVCSSLMHVASIDCSVRFIRSTTEFDWGRKAVVLVLSTCKA